MDNTYKKKWQHLRNYLEMIPVEQDNFFRIEAVNGTGISCLGLIDKEDLKMDWISMESTIETRWTFQDRGIHFLVNKGRLEIRFRLNDNIHTKMLHVEQSIRIPPGIPFQLITFDKSCSLLLISVKET